ncbi:MAG: hypothetical protein QM723_07040 [Myxococcaceae bacterium]
MTTGDKVGLAILGLVVVGGGGFAVYKLTQPRMSLAPQGANVNGQQLPATPNLAPPQPQAAQGAGGDSTAATLNAFNGLFQTGVGLFNSLNQGGFFN